MEVVYFELNNWFAGRDYPDAQPFKTWMADNYDEDDEILLMDDYWVENNKLVVVMSVIDMSFNFCVTAPKEWIERNCPDLLTRYTKFLRQPKPGESLPHGRFDCPFLEYKPENIGVTYYNDGKDCMATKVMEYMNLKKNDSTD